MSVDPSHQVLFGGELDTAMDFGGWTLQTLSTENGRVNGFLVKLSATGAHVFSRKVGYSLVLKILGLSRKIRTTALVDRMSNVARNPIELPDDLQAFAEEQVRAGKSPSVAAVVREALEDKKLAVLREALDVGIAELDAGKGVELSPEELMDEVFADVGLEP